MGSYCFSKSFLYVYPVSEWLEMEHLPFFAVVCLLLAFGREMHPPKLTVKGFNHWVGQLRWIKEEQLIALREVCHLSGRWSAVPGAMWHVANLSETALPDRRSHPTFSICSCSNHCVVHWCFIRVTSKVFLVICPLSSENMFARQVAQILLTLFAACLAEGVILWR